MNIQLTPISIDNKQLLKDMLFIYEKELTGKSEEYKYLDSYFIVENRYPFFIEADNNIVGFVLVNEYCLIEKDAKSIGEFFVSPNYRKQSIGSTAAKMVFDSFPGKWEIRELSSNQQGQDFWRKVISNYTNGNYREVELNNPSWQGPVQLFRSL